MDTSKIIKGVVNSGRYTVTAPIVKEDYGLYLQIEGVELPSTYEVDFSNSEHNGTSVTMIGNSDGVLIPHQFIDTGKDIFAFLYHVGEDFGRTIYKFRIPNKVRPDRTDDTPTPEQASVIDQAISALNEAVEQTAQDVIDAAASASAASQSAENAHDSAVDAQNYAESAQTSATQASASASQASASATASANSASASAQIKADVEDLVDDAQGYAQASAQSASASANSASQASGYAQSASASAQSASTSASAALTYANTASNKASEASASASTASTKASEASASALSASGYATQAEQAKTSAQTAQGLAESARDSAISAKNDAEQAKADAESARDEAQTIVDGISAKTTQIDSNTENIASLTKDKAPVITDTASGAIASFSDGADDIPLKSLVVDINPVQDLHGQDAPYPAGGGKNLINQPDIASTSATTTISANIASGETYTLSAICSPESQSARVRISYILNGETVWTFGNQIIAPTSAVSSATVTVPDGVTELSLSFQPLNSGRSAYSKIQLEKGSTATSYAPYENICPISGWTEVNVNHSDADTSNPTTITISLGQTVYGGKLDVLSGELVIDRAMIASYNGETLPSTWISDRDAYAQGATPTTGAQVVYKLATPTTVQLTPHEVATLLGVNNIFADTGDTEVVYRADTKLYIERLTAPDSADMIADANITSGQYFMVGNSLYKATANIANGGQITVGTNCTRVSLAQALNEINA